MLDIRTAQNDLEDYLRDTILKALGKRLPSVPDVASLRAVATQGATSSIRSDNDLINIVVAGIVTTAFRWSTVSTAADNGTTVIQPDDVTGQGRWLAWTSNVRLAPTVGGNSYFLHELLDGPLAQVIVLDKSMPVEEMNALILGQVPAVCIEASGDEPEDMGQHVGWRYDTTFDFKVTTIGENLRALREATHGSLDGDIGVNAIDGLVQSLLGGVNIAADQDSIRTVKLGHGDNYVSDLGQRRVHRERALRLLCTVENPPAPNDSYVVDEVGLQAELTDLHDQSISSDSNYVVDGIEVVVDMGLSQFVTAGSAVIGGVAVNYVGEYRTFPANSDIYRDLLPNGTIAFVAVGANESPPPVTSTALRVGVCTTDGANVVGDRFIAITRQPYGPTYVIPV